MAINQDVHKAVVVVTTRKNGDAVNLGFSALADAIYFVSEQVTEEIEKKDTIVEALDTDGTVIDGTKFQIMDIESYLDLYEESESETDEDDE